MKLPLDLPRQKRPVAPRFENPHGWTLCSWCGKRMDGPTYLGSDGEKVEDVCKDCVFADGC